MEVVEVKEDFKEKFRFLIKKVQKLHLNSNKKLLNKMANKEQMVNQAKEVQDQKMELKAKIMDMNQIPHLYLLLKNLKIM